MKSLTKTYIISIIICYTEFLQLYQNTEVLLIMTLGLILVGLMIGICIGIMIMHYKNKNFSKNQQTLYKELQINKIKFNEYQKTLTDHFNYSIQLLNNISNDYQNLYQHIKKNAKLLLPHENIKHELYTLHLEKNKKHTKLPIETPRDYFDDNFNKKKTNQ